MHGLNLYDYSARHYDPAIGRFTSVDPHAESYYSWSPYAYCLNNPISNTDPDGRDVKNGHKEELENAKTDVKDKETQLNESREDNGGSTKTRNGKIKKAENELRKSMKNQNDIQKKYDEVQARIDDFKSVDPENFSILDNLTYTRSAYGKTIELKLDVVVRSDTPQGIADGGSTTFTVTDGIIRSESGTNTVTTKISKWSPKHTMAHEGGHAKALSKNPTTYYEANYNLTKVHDCQDSKNKDHPISKIPIQRQNRCNLLRKTMGR